MNVELLDFMGGDASVVRSAQVSTLGADATEAHNPGLIGYLMRNKHASPFEHSVFTFYVHAPIFVTREMLRHRWSSFNEECLAGDTIITRMEPRGTSTTKKNSQISTMYRNWHEGVPDSKGRVRLLPSCKNIHVKSFDELTGKPTVSKVVDIVKTTGKTTWLVTTESGRQVRTSQDHKYFTPDNGWRRLSELTVGSLVYRGGLVRVDGEPVIPPRLRQGIQIWTSQLKPHIIPSHGSSCYVCEKQLDYKEVQLDHVVPVVLDLKMALDKNNIKPICKKCHRAKSNFEQRYASRGVGGGIRSDKIVSITDPRQEDTYDLVLDGPHHNFLANGLVVHNSGRYRQLDTVFYYPDQLRPLVQVGKTSDYRFTMGADLREPALALFNSAYGIAEEAYKRLLDLGVAREVARMVLPVGTYSSLYFTVNARSLMNFLSLRLDPTAQWEIRWVAEEMQAHFAEQMPATYKAWASAGRESI